MFNHADLAIVDLGLEETELFLIGLLVVVVSAAAVIILRMHRQLGEQSKLNRKLSQTVDKVLRIDSRGDIDRDN